MSGTSLDGADAVLADLEGGKTSILAAVHVAFETDLRDALEALTRSGADEIDRSAVLGNRLAEIYADAALRTLAQARQSAAAVRAIGCHGQTVRHRPEHGYTVQIGNAALLAELTGIAVVADFRSRDVAAGGQGAPLVPAFHARAFSAPDEERAILNLGGIANVTVVAEHIEEVFAFDTGPANMPLDETVRILTSGREQYDRDGRTAAKGRIDENLLRKLLSHPYLKQVPPKTTGRETFGSDFVLPLLRAKGGQTGVDVLATLTAFSAHSIRQAFDDFVAPRARPTEIIVSGGGVHNLTLMGHLRHLFTKERVFSLAETGIDPDAKEALIFAVLANETIKGIPNNVPGATGARWPTVLGKVTP